MTAIADAMNEALSIGINIELSSELVDGEHAFLTNGNVEAVAAAGFKSIRLPTFFATHSDDAGGLGPEFLSRVDAAVQRVLDLGMVAVLDMHGYSEIMSDPEGNLDKFLTMWDRIASRYQSWSDNLVFEILNEPNGELNPTLWNDYCAQALAVIRQYNSERVVLIDVGEYANYAYLGDLDLDMIKSDPAAIVTVHFYYPELFTMWGQPGFENGSDWTGNENELPYIITRLDDISSFAETTGIPICIGEFGCCKLSSPEEHRLTWVDFVNGEFRDRGFSRLYWELYRDFGIYNPDTGEWTDGILEVLIED
ncbi:endoglucanase [Vibrio xiamenensis]|uniref:Endoglucanase n=1 Tax=Vibrio xiamenensis TaxID=861298 RepID=A0A1G8CG96_9VIBR|nr:glycoside hydrolase family 5 protein [Vibrio xiamenensis]SDH43900.1 endoglucanase [Vibrio xiamenensis]